FMFDMVSSHGGAWLNAPKFKDRRRNLLRAMLEKKKVAVGRTDLTELETLEVIAHMIADVSLERWRDNVRVRKLWFVRGSGKVHGKFWDLARDFGVTDGPANFGSRTGAKELLEEWETDHLDKAGDADDLAREWEAFGDEQLLPWETSESAPEAFEDLALDEGPLEELEGGVEELCEEEDPDVPEAGEEEFVAGGVAPWGGSPPAPEGAWGESEEEGAYFPVETAYVEEEPAPSEEAWNEPEEEAGLGENELDASLGKTLYLPIRLSQVVPPKVGVFLPSGFRPTSAVDILVYFHGHIIPDCKTYPGEFNKAGMGYY